LQSIKHMRRYWFLTFILIIAADGFAANWYVLKGATGSNNGTNWTNAWNEMNQINWSSVACGDTIWLGGGTYTTGLTVGKTCTASTVLNINRVLSTDTVPTAAAGWNSAYASQVIFSNALIQLSAGAYYTINGRVGNAVTGTAYGIQSVRTSGGDAVDSPSSGTADHVSLYYIELYGPVCVTNGNCTGSAAYGLNWNFNGTIQNSLADHMWIHRWCETVRMWNALNNTIQFSIIGDTNNDSIDHEDIVYTAPPNSGNTWRYNRIYSSPNDGLFSEFGGQQNFAFYGNIIYHAGGWEMCFKNGSTFGPVFIYNNTFENDGTFGDYQPAWLGQPGSLAAGSDIANNIFYNVDNQISPTYSSYNAYSLNGYSESGSVTFTPGSPLNAYNGFVNMSSGNPIVADLHLTSARQALFENGKTLSAPYNMDPDGNTRGTNGHWYMGAYQYVTSNSPAPPTNLTATPH
jgi:hypothetical protein